MDQIVLDIGNTRTKIGVFSGLKLTKVIKETNLDDILNVLNQYPEALGILGAVGEIPEEVLHIVKKPNNRWMVLGPETRVPIENRYYSPETLGMDRLAGVCGAVQRFPSEASLVIDAGSCVTFDLIDEKGVYHGGSISPGWQMRLRAMHEFTRSLPLLQGEVPAEIMGKSTVECMQSGAFYGLLSEMREIISHYRAKFNTLHVVLCGGDAPAFLEQLDGKNILLEPDLVLYGLQAILLHNAKK
ncbi:MULTISPECIES: type III pantothenate kinase [Persicobacter]|uniref:Type III pantothenate kinase n=1 Tax=Persicobacter diffluens TaxID=981 RepID=A0AAN5AJP9_9BACT|nr:type III pantothenate kinase [Persicobacter sp. CCB-QB2]GJM59696.1 type III pantothenate kinase [Persicobacter diffluens]